MLIGYARVSKNNNSQSTIPQKNALMEYGVYEENIYEDYASGASDKKIGLFYALKALREGDTLVVWSLDRLSRISSESSMIRDRIYQKRAYLKVLTMEGDEKQIFTPNGKFMANTVSNFAEYERDRNIERTKLGIAAARESGVIFGRKPKLTVTQLKLIQEQFKNSDKNCSIRQIAKAFNISRQILYRYISSNGDLTPYGEAYIQKCKI